MAMTRHMRVVDGGNMQEKCETALKVAFATSDMKHVNQHFGSAETFALYAIDPDGDTLLEAAQFGKLEQDGNEDKLAAKIGMLEGCAAVYCQAVGSSAVKQLIASGVQPMKVSPSAEIKDLIESLRDEMLQGPSAWLAKAISRNQEPDMGRFDEMDSEGWDE